MKRPEIVLVDIYLLRHVDPLVLGNHHRRRRLGRILLVRLRRHRPVLSVPSSSGPLAVAVSAETDLMATISLDR